jgi:hypothetical protein
MGRAWVNSFTWLLPQTTPMPPILLSSPAPCTSKSPRQAPPPRPHRTVFRPAPLLVVLLAGLCLPAAFGALVYLAYLLFFVEGAHWRAYTIIGLTLAPTAQFSVRCVSAPDQFFRRPCVFVRGYGGVGILLGYAAPSAKCKRCVRRYRVCQATRQLHSAVPGLCVGAQPTPFPHVCTCVRVCGGVGIMCGCVVRPACQPSREVLGCVTPLQAPTIHTGCPGRPLLRQRGPAQRRVHPWWVMVNTCSLRGCRQEPRVC